MGNLTPFQNLGLFGTHFILFIFWQDLCEGGAKSVPLIPLDQPTKDARKTIKKTNKAWLKVSRLLAAITQSASHLPAAIEKFYHQQIFLWSWPIKSSKSGS
jgi:hypothetical protein